MLMRDVVVVMRGMGVRVRLLAVMVFVCVRGIVGVLLGHGFPFCEIRPLIGLR
jgi:hypothetical protein